MIINDKAAEQRLESPMNLINRLRTASPESRKNNAMSLFTGPDRKDKQSFDPFKGVNHGVTQEKSGVIAAESITPPSNSDSPVLDNIIHDAESEIKLGLTHNNAISLLHDAVEALKTKLNDVSAAKLPSVIASASKVVESIRKERNEVNRSNKDREVHYHFYTPEQRKLKDYEVIEVQ